MKSLSISPENLAWLKQLARTQKPARPPAQVARQIAGMDYLTLSYMTSHKRVL